MKTIKYFFLILFPVILIAIGCDESFLDTKNLYEKSDESYYKTPEDIEEALAGAYAAIPLDKGKYNPFIVSELMSDDCFGGGGIDDIEGQSTDAFTLPNENYYDDLFGRNWQGILRVNLIIKRFDQAKYTDEQAKNQALGEAHFLRAYFYFRLSQFFGPVPLKLEPTPANLPRATAEQMYGQIASDLKKAIELMPAINYQTFIKNQVNRLGHVSKWAAEALMARVFLFYTGYYEKSELPLAEGGAITKNEVIAWGDDCIQNSGHDLLPDFRNNWLYSSVQRYPYTKNNGLSWAGETGGNYETIWAIKYSPYGGWEPPRQELSYSNQHSLYLGLRDQFYIPFGQGWGWCTVNPQLWESFEPGDIRREGSILNVNIPNPDEGNIPQQFIWGSNNQMHETGYWQKKYMPIYDSIGKYIKGVYFIQYGSPDNMQLWNMQDDVLIRFADVLLMGAELGSANASEYFNRVRTRAGLDPIASPTLEDIKRERRHELAFEGLRHFDLLRWHDAEQAHSQVVNIPVKNVGIDALYNDTYRPETGGFLPIPKSEITLSEGVLEQTPGWEEYQ